MYTCCAHWMTQETISSVTATALYSCFISPAAFLGPPRKQANASMEPRDAAIFMMGLVLCRVLMWLPPLLALVIGNNTERTGTWVHFRVLDIGCVQPRYTHILPSTILPPPPPPRTHPDTQTPTPLLSLGEVNVEWKSCWFGLAV